MGVRMTLLEIELITILLLLLLNLPINIYKKNKNYRNLKKKLSFIKNILIIFN